MVLLAAVGLVALTGIRLSLRIYRMEQVVEVNHILLLTWARTCGDPPDAQKRAVEAEMQRLAETQRVPERRQYERRQPTSGTA